MVHRILIILALGIALVALTPRVANAAGDDPVAVPYELTEGSSLEIGCQPPCKCPIYVIESVRGRFALTYTGSDPLFNHYAVTDLQWRYHGPDGDVQVTGSGTYSIGGEFARQHRLVLDLVVGNRPAQRFDSGTVVGGSSFPAIEIDVAAHGFYCFDSVFAVRAKPVSAGVGDGQPRAGLGRIAPNPFRSSVAIEFSLRAPESIALSILDLQGRRVRSLLYGVPLEAGLHRVEWDGRDDAFRSVRPGTYQAVLAGPGTADHRTIVKLR